MNIAGRFCFLLLFCVALHRPSMLLIPDVNVEPMRNRSNHSSRISWERNLNGSAANELYLNNTSYFIQDSRVPIYPVRRFFGELIGRGFAIDSVYIVLTMFDTYDHVCNNYKKLWSFKMFGPTGTAVDDKYMFFSFYRGPDCSDSECVANKKKIYYMTQDIIFIDGSGKQKYYVMYKNFEVLRYLISWSDAADKDISTDVQTYKGYNNVCYPGMHFGQNSYGMYTFEDTGEIVLSGFVTSDCSGPAAESRVAKPNTVGQSGDRYFTAIAKRVDKTPDIVYRCIIYDGADYDDYSGIVLYNQCDTDPMGNGYIWVFDYDGEVIRVYYYYYPSCTTDVVRNYEGKSADVTNNEKNSKIRIYNDFTNLEDHEVVLRIDCQNYI